MDGKFIPCAKMFLLTLGRDPIEGFFLTKDLKIQFGPPADLAAAHKWWRLSDRHHSGVLGGADPISGDGQFQPNVAVVDCYLY